MTQPETLADVLARLGADPGLAPTRRRDLASALRTLARAARADPAATPATFPALRALAAGKVPAALGLSPKRWANVRADAAAALRHAGVAPEGRRPAATLPEPWRALRAAMAGDVALRCGLARLVAFCADRGIAPGAVDDAALEGFRAWLEAGTLVPDPGRVQRRACLEWNRAAGLVPGWPGREVAVPDRRDRLGLPPGTFPASFLADVDAWQARLAGEDLFDEAGPAKPLRPATLRHTRHQVLAAASACVRAGCDPGGAAGPRRPGRAGAPEARARVPARAVRRREHGGAGRARGHAGQRRPPLGPARPARAQEARAHARQAAAPGARPDREEPGPARPVRRPARPARPARAARQAPAPGGGRGRPGQGGAAGPDRAAGAAAAPGAAAHAQPAGAPPRPPPGAPAGPEGRAAARRGWPSPRTRPRTASRSSSRCRRSWSAPSTSTSAATGGTWCAARTRAGCSRATRAAPKHAVSLADQIKGAVRRHTGLEVHPHLFRHLAAKLLLQEAPGAYEAARRLLGHRSVDTTTLYYTGLDTARAVGAYQERLLERRGRLRGAGEGARRG